MNTGILLPVTRDGGRPTLVGLFLSPRDGDADGLVGVDRRVAGARPRARLEEVLAGYIEQRDLAPQYGDRLDGHRNHPAVPAEPTASADDQNVFSCGAAYNLRNLSQSAVVVIEDRQTKQVSNPDGLRETSVHFLLWRQTIIPRRPRLPMGPAGPLVADGRRIGGPDGYAQRHKCEDHNKEMSHDVHGVALTVSLVIDVYVVGHRYSR